MNISVLVVEDNPDHQALAQLHLARGGIDDVEIVPTLQTGVEACRRRARDVIVVDSGVVSEEGLEAIANLRRCAKHARIIGYSAGARTEDWADAHFLKGDFQELTAEVHKGRIS